ncbi:MerR family transcriptional regulator [Neobittarella massiliensis]|uniref:MerR family transcriptional regulator n=1 Tax=Neobittarella massiliensis (ex Bilen et al. 2018) TaxID=2041842 RepID=UPI0013EBB2EE|nr:MerR family transcriptional regulator [Neobittarella massiliensis]
MKKYPVRLTTAQFADLHGLCRRTLHYYDQIGLFSPSYKGENGYRYYDAQQTIELGHIRMLKELGVQLSEIRTYRQHPSADAFLQMADARLQQIDEELKKLRRAKKILQQKKEMLHTCRRVQSGQVELVQCPATYLLTAPMPGDDSHQAAAILGQLWQADEYQTGFGSYISADKVYRGDFSVYDGLFVPVPASCRSSRRLVLPAGDYLCGYWVGDWDGLPRLYDKMLQFSRENHLKLTGYACELGLNELAIADMSQYVTRVTVAVAPS